MFQTTSKVSPFRVEIPCSFCVCACVCAYRRDLCVCVLVVVIAPYLSTSKHICYVSNHIKSFPIPCGNPLCILCVCMRVCLRACFGCVCVLVVVIALYLLTSKHICDVSNHIKGFPIPCRNPLFVLCVCVCMRVCLRACFVCVGMFVCVLLIGITPYLPTSKHICDISNYIKGFPFPCGNSLFVLCLCLFVHACAYVRVCVCV